ncbi:hypothetical protein CPB86DRAFT_788618 [Serendipita vermifera]|nr:hypothetical protein CPB86DRAFT_788618 [Serendipita vermifera]
MSSSNLRSDYKSQVHELAAKKRVGIFWECFTRGPQEKIQWRCTCTLTHNGVPALYAGDWKGTKRDAEESAAEEAIGPLKQWEKSRTP